MQPNISLPSYHVPPGALAAIPYRCIQFKLRDGSQFFVLLSNLLELAVQHMGATGISPEVLLREQLLPAVVEQPELALEIARQMDWQALKAVAFGAQWRTPLIFVTEAYQPGAILTLQSEVPVDFEN